ncbi:proA [Symbiodinium necroappetens]|uniref:glutamate-5-semialdehyde dehydrogenase n=1 Tax=Symbiodinium necroappetens TaxID=1628268 RepID=A0A813AAR5_9DINO|nr:proA [Symbiodinium necroappetens]
MEEVAKRARLASQNLAGSSEGLRNKALEAFKKHLLEKRALIEEANAQDKAEAEVAVKAGKLSSSLFKRLDVSGAKFDTLLKGIDEILSLPDPIGQVTYANKVAEGLNLYRLTCPIGVLLIIFEARPDAAVQIASLAMKSGNALLLKGGKEAQRSNAALVTAMSAALQDVGLPADCIQGVDTRTEVAELLKQDKYIDLVIPRGSNELVRSIKDASRIPVMGHADGICAVYVDSKADLEKAVKIVVDSKTHYCAACNSMETLLVHEDVCASFLPKLAVALEAKDDVHYKADPKCLPHLPVALSEPVTEDDFDTEFLCHTMAVKAVTSAQEAIDHINSHSSGHTESIVTEDPMIAEAFLSRIDSAGVYHNCSTRFADGFRYGFGAEVGISTNRIHARGPVGLEGLVIHKYRMYGDGHTVTGFAGTTPEHAFVHSPVPGVARVDDIPQAKKART